MSILKNSIGVFLAKFYHNIYEGLPVNRVFDKIIEIISVQDNFLDSILRQGRIGILW